MANFIDHIHQAKHNRECAHLFITSNPKLRDWAITAAFYSAVHMVEAGFSQCEIEHTEKSCPSNKSPHDYRESMVMKEYGRECYKSYRQLRQASFNVRYLANWETQAGEALDFYNLKDAKDFIEIDLLKVKEIIERELGTTF